MVTNLDDDENYLPSSLNDTFNTYSAPISTYGDLEPSMGNDKFVPFVSAKSGFPSMLQKVYINNVAMWTYCAPTAAANITRYRYLYYGLEYGDSTWNNYTGYESLIKSIGVAMKTGTEIAGTLDTSVATNFENWLLNNTDQAATVEAKLHRKDSHDVDWEDYYSSIVAGDPVMITVGNSIFKNLGPDDYHNVTGYGYYTGIKLHTYAFVADPQDASLKEILYENNGPSYIYALYPVHFD